MKRFFDTYYMMKTGLSAAITLMLLVSGCATVPERNAALDSARAAYEKAQANPEVDKVAPVAMHEAAQALQKAEQAKNVEEKNYLSYIAERKAQIAVALAEQRLADKESEELSKEKDRIILQARELETKRAIGLAEARALGG